MYEHHKEEIMKIPLKILDETEKHIEFIDHNVLQGRKGFEIAQKFGFDFTCELGKKHHYSE